MEELIWNNTPDLLRTLESFSADGAVIVLKMDGERGVDRFTLSISKGKLGDDFIRMDGSNVELLLRSAISAYHRS